MISNARVKKVFAYIVPLLGIRSQAELDAIYADLEKILGYDAKKAARQRVDTKERDRVMQALMRASLAHKADDTDMRPRMPMV